MLASFQYILTCLGWECIEKLITPSYIFNPDCQSRQLQSIEKRTLSRSDRSVLVVLYSNNDLTRSLIPMTKNQVIVMSGGRLVKAKDLEIGDKIYQCKMSKQKWTVYKLQEIRLKSAYHIITDRHFYIVNGCYAILGDDSNEFNE